MKRVLLSILAALSLLAPTAVFAQAGTTKVVGTCGTQTYVAGTMQYPTQDTTGTACTAGGGGGGGGAVTVADGADVTQGALADAACATDNGTCSVNAVIKRIAQRLTTINTTLTGVALDASITTTNTNLGVLGSTTCATDTGSCNLNAKLSRIAERLTTVNTSIGSAVTGYAQASTTAGQLGPLQQVATTTSAPTYTTGTTNPQSVDIHGGARTLIQDTNGTALDYTTTTPVAQIGPYPGTNSGGTVGTATPITCSSGNVANGTTACTLAATSGKTTYIQGLIMSSDGATVALGVGCTITGTITGTMNFVYDYGVITAQNSPLALNFGIGIPASATNTTLVMSCPASGTGGLHSSMTAWGYQL